MVPANSNKDSPKDSKGKVATSSKNAQAKDHNGRTSEEPEPKKQKMTEQEQIEQNLRENGINVIDFAYVDRSPPKKRSKKSSAKGSHPKDTSAVRDTPSPSASSDTTDGSKQGKLMNLRYRHPAPPMGMEYTLADRPKLPREPSPATIAEEIRKFRLAHKNAKPPESVDADDVDD